MYPEQLKIVGLKFKTQVQAAEGVRDWDSSISAGMRVQAVSRKGKNKKQWRD